MIEFNEEWLKGTHLLSGVDSIKFTEVRPQGYQERVNANLFTVDMKTYTAIEDPDDGYRSYCSDIEECDRKPSYQFPYIEVKIMNKYKEDGFRGIEFLDILSEEIILRIRTDYSYDYYPCCTFEWYPEKMHINKTRKISNKMEFN